VLWASLVPRSASAFWSASLARMPSRPRTSSIDPKPRTPTTSDAARLRSLVALCLTTTSLIGCASGRETASADGCALFAAIIPETVETDFVFGPAVPEAVRDPMRTTYRRIDRHDELYLERCAP
jgi:hypothetical protein